MDETGKTGGRGWIKMALGLSVAANLFFLGLMGGKLLEGKPERRDAAPNSFLETLSEDRRTEVKAYFAEMREDRKASRQTTRNAWAAVREAMTADPYDRAALEAAMDQVMQARTERSQARYAKMVDFVSTMSAEERAAFSNAMSERWRKRRDRRQSRENN